MEWVRGEYQKEGAENGGVGAAADMEEVGEGEEAVEHGTEERSTRAMYL